MVYVNQYIESFIHIDYLLFPIIGAFILLVFNLRKDAATTAGSVGSMTIGFWVSFLLMMLIIESGSIIWLSFEELVIDDNIITSRVPEDLPVFVKAIEKALITNPVD